jgi:hypothetical protein
LEQEMMNKTVWCALMLLGTGVPGYAVEYREEFDVAGKPAESVGIDWHLRDEMLPTDWSKVIPGDGYAYLTIDADRENDQSKKGNKKWPFQMIAFDSVGPGHVLEMRAKNTVIPGVASFIFTYTEADGVVDEIDIEIVGNDRQAPPADHPTGPDGGWTDARFNTWANSDWNTLKPHISRKQAVVNAAGEKVSHADGQFHVYRIEWRAERVDFYIDGVHQQTITGVVPDSPSRVLVGMRHMMWTGALDWEGTRTMVIDWVQVTPIVKMKKTATSRDEL